MSVNQLLKNNDEPKIIKTDADSKDGQNKCPQCGATDISVNAKTGKLRCNFCRHEFEPEKIQGMETDITKLEGEITRIEKKLSNEGFVSKAPEAVINGEKEKLVKYKEMLDAVLVRIDTLK